MSRVTGCHVLHCDIPMSALCRTRLALLRRNTRVRLDLLGDDHEEMVGGGGGEVGDAVGLFWLGGGAEFVGVVPEEVLDVEEALVVQVLEGDDGALAEAALD